MNYQEDKRQPYVLLDLTHTKDEVIHTSKVYLLIITSSSYMSLVENFKDKKKFLYFIHLVLVGTKNQYAINIHEDIQRTISIEFARNTFATLILSHKITA